MMTPGEEGKPKSCSEKKKKVVHNIEILTLQILPSLQIIYSDLEFIFVLAADLALIPRNPGRSVSQVKSLEIGQLSNCVDFRNVDRRNFEALTL